MQEPGGPPRTVSASMFVIRLKIKESIDMHSAADCSSNISIKFIVTIPYNVRPPSFLPDQGSAMPAVRLLLHGYANGAAIRDLRPNPARQAHSLKIERLRLLPWTPRRPASTSFTLDAAGHVARG